MLDLGGRTRDAAAQDAGHGEWAKVTVTRTAGNPNNLGCATLAYTPLPNIYVASWNPLRRGTSRDEQAPGLVQCPATGRVGAGGTVADAA